MVKAFILDEREREFSSNTYVIGKIGGDCLIVDPGCKNEELYSYIETHHERCLGILLTHGHFDHAGGVSDLQKKFKNWNIPVYLHSQDKLILNDPVLNASFLVNKHLRMTFDTIDVNDDETLTFKGFKIKVIHTPFHTRGSVIYLSEDDNALFTGDTLFQGSVGRSDLQTSTPNDMEKSLAKIMALKDTLVVYPGHGPITNLRKEKSSNPFLSALRK